MTFRSNAWHGCNSFPLSRLQSQRNNGGDDENNMMRQTIDDSFSKANAKVNANTNDNDEPIMTEAATNTINERLMAELVQAENKERYGKRSTMTKKSMGISPFGSMLSDEERQMAIEEARNLNGVNPAVAIVGGLVGVFIATGLWLGTSSLGTFFALHPVDTDVYFFDSSHIRLSEYRHGPHLLGQRLFWSHGSWDLGVGNSSGIWRHDWRIGSDAHQET